MIRSVLLDGWIRSELDEKDTSDHMNADERWVSLVRGMAVGQTGKPYRLDLCT